MDYGVIERRSFVSLDELGLQKQLQDSVCTLKWKYASDGYVPVNAVIAGNSNGETCYVGRACHELTGELCPGKIQPSRQALVYSYCGKELLESNYEVLVCHRPSPSSIAQQPRWVKLRNGDNTLLNAVSYNRSTNFNSLYVGRYFVGKTLAIGPLQHSAADDDEIHLTPTSFMHANEVGVHYAKNSSGRKCDEVLVFDQQDRLRRSSTAPLDFESGIFITSKTSSALSARRSSIDYSVASSSKSKKPRPVPYNPNDAAYDAYVMNDSSAFWRARKRIVALLVTLIIELFVGFVITRFTATLQAEPLLISFMPVISAISGNVGLQCSSIVTRALACSLTTVGDFKRAIGRELGAALYLATVIGAGVAIISGVWRMCFNFGLVIGAAQFMSIMSAALSGSAAPLVGKFIRMDPAAFAGPMETALQDVVGNSFFLLVASLVLGAWPCPKGNAEESLCPTQPATTVDAGY